MRVLLDHRTTTTQPPAPAPASPPPTAPRTGLPTIGLALVWLGAATLGALVAMVVLGALGAPSGPTAADQVADLADGSTVVYRWGFVAAALVNVLLVATVASLLYGLAAVRGLRLADVVGGLFLAVYLPLTLAAYVSQFTVLPSLLAGDPGTATTWLFGADGAVPTALDFLGYAVWGTGATVLGLDLVRRPAEPVASTTATLLPTLGWLFVASGVASVVGLVGLGLGVDVLRSATTVGGALIAPLLAVVVWLGRRWATPPTGDVPV